MMNKYNKNRVFQKNQWELNTEGEYVLYWMQINRRFHYNFALEYAIDQANELEKPLLVMEALSCDYPWATVRTHTFIMQGMKEHLDYARERNLNYVSFVEEKPGQYAEVLNRLCTRASLLVTDEYPVFIMRKRNEKLPGEFGIPYITVDSNGLIPLGLTDKDPYSAYLFRKIVQKNFLEAYTNPPVQHPLEKLKNREISGLPDECFKDLPETGKVLNNSGEFVSGLSVRQDVNPVGIHGERSAGLRILGEFIEKRLHAYGEKRNNPDDKKTSMISPWLHMGKISAFEVTRAVLQHQPDGWDLHKISYNNGSKAGFFNGDPNIDDYLDELITWREIGFHFAHHRSDYDQFESLPEWARTTLNDHRKDPREWNYSYEDLEKARTHDEIWNAAQSQLREEGVIHNYLRMLWGKKVLEWTPDPETAIQYLIDLNNTWAIDGRDPNSYSGIFWCFGRFDRAWQERDVFGKIRYMSSDSARKKLKLAGYLKQYGT